MSSTTSSYSTYAISLNFDEATNTYIRSLMASLAQASGNFYMTEHKVPPHLTLGIFHCQDSDLEKLKELFDSFSSNAQSIFDQGLTLDFEGLDNFLDKVIFLKPKKSQALQKLNEELHKKLLPYFEAGDNRNYLPENYFPHIALGVKLTPAQFEKGMKVLTAQGIGRVSEAKSGRPPADCRFGGESRSPAKPDPKGCAQITSISLALCKPYEVIRTFPLKLFYHLPGLFEFYELYRLFLPLFRNHKDWFYPWCEIGSIYGSPADCLWGGGRAGFGQAAPGEVKALLEEFGISARLTFSNSLLKEEHLSDRHCNSLCRLFSSAGVSSGVIVHSDLLASYLQQNYPELYLVSSTTKVLTDFDDFVSELDRPDFRYVVPDFRLNRDFERLCSLSQVQKDKVEFLCNECCSFDCRQRKACYENVSRLNIGLDQLPHQCKAEGGQEGYKFSLAMKNPAFIGLEDLSGKYRNLGFSNFKIEGRGLGSAMILEFLLYYLTKPEYQLQVREAIYLDSMLDLF